MSRNVNALTKEQIRLIQCTPEWLLLMRGEENPEAIIQYLVKRMSDSAGVNYESVVNFIGQEVMEGDKNNETDTR